MEKLLWAGSSSIVSKISGSDTFDQIPQGIWELKLSMTGPFLQKVSDNFHFGHKIYGLEQDFIDYSIKSFKVAEKNMGLLLNGLKGCGKTVTAKILANNCGLPVIIVNSSNIDSLSYFNNVNQPLCFMFDEFEKIINHKDTERIAPLLSFVDGTITIAKHFMIFTSNDTNISEFFIDRPGRIRYIKNYGSLNIETVKEILNDKLEYPEFKQEIIEWVMFFKFLTIDMLISIINEVNIHGVGPNRFKPFFNANNDKPTYDITVTCKDLETGEAVVFETNRMLNYDPAQYVDNLIDSDDNLYISGHKTTLNVTERHLTIPSTAFPTDWRIRNITEWNGELQDNEFKIIGTIEAENPLSKEGSTENIVPVFMNHDKSAFIQCNKSMEIELKFKARPLYKNYSSFAF